MLYYLFFVLLYIQMKSIAFFINKLLTLNFILMNKSKIKAKRIECFIGLFLCVPPILGVIAFTLQIFGADLYFSELRHLSSNWTFSYSYESVGSGMSAAPIYLGLMAIAGTHLV